MATVHRGWMEGRETPETRLGVASYRFYRRALWDNSDVLRSMLREHDLRGWSKGASRRYSSWTNRDSRNRCTRNARAAWHSRPWWWD